MDGTGFIERKEVIFWTLLHTFFFNFGFYMKISKIAIKKTFVDVWLISQ